MGDPVSAHKDPVMWLRRQAAMAASNVYADALRACADALEDAQTVTCDHNDCDRTLYPTQRASSDPEPTGFRCWDCLGIFCYEHGGQHFSIDRQPGCNEVARKKAGWYDEVLEDRLAMSQAIYLALRCDKCSISGEHRVMLEKHAEAYENAVSVTAEEDENDEEL